MNFVDPTAIFEVAFARRDVIFPEPGEYALQVLCGGQFLREKRVWALSRGFPEANE